MDTFTSKKLVANVGQYSYSEYGRLSLVVMQPDLSRVKALINFTAPLLHREGIRTGFLLLDFIFIPDF